MSLKYCNRGHCAAAWRPQADSWVSNSLCMAGSRACLHIKTNVKTVQEVDDGEWHMVTLTTLSKQAQASQEIVPTSPAGTAMPAGAPFSAN
eukprot:1155902-Pelagomonas_calceolata.AAC.4